MNMNKSICPVPQDQRPINEYLALKETFGFSWTTKNDSVYYKTSLKIYFITLTLFVLIFNTANSSLMSLLTLLSFGCKFHFIYILSENIFRLDLCLHKTNAGYCRL